MLLQGAAFIKSQSYWVLPSPDDQDGENSSPYWASVDSHWENGAYALHSSPFCLQEGEPLSSTSHKLLVGQDILEPFVSMFVIGDGFEAKAPPSMTFCEKARWAVT